jgi:uncharacterized protein
MKVLIKMFYHYFRFLLGFLSIFFYLPSSMVAHEKPNIEDSHCHELIKNIQTKTLLSDFVEHLDFSLTDLSLDASAFDSDPFWNRNLPPSCFLEETTILSEEQATKNKALSENPKWAEGSPEKVREYYAIHQEGHIDRMLGYVACRLGVIVHGDVNQEQLAINLNRFDIHKLLMEGPDQHAVLSLEAQQLIYASLIDTNKIFDIHLHNLGYDEGNYLNPKASAFGVASWMDYFTFLVLRYASGMSSPQESTHEARKRIHLYAEHFPKLCGIVLPIHKAILPNGMIDWDNTGNFLKNRSALLTALNFQNSSSELLPAISVHPFDLKWKEKLLKAHQKGIRLVKWMPPQSIPPDSDLLDEYYDTLKLLEMVLIAHAGPEHAIPTHEGNKQWIDWGNPLRFRKPLQMGVNVILAHCGHKDHIPDLDDPDQPEVPGYQLFLRLAKEAHEKNQTGEWAGKLYGDLAAVTTHYGPDFIRELLLHANEEGVRLIYGSDYPYTNLIKPKNDAYDICAQAGLLDPEKVEALKEIRAWNPLLANYIFTKNLELQLPNGERLEFPESTFTGEFKDAELKLIDQEIWQDYKINSIK